MRSLQSRLLLRTVAVVALALTVSSVVVYSVVASNLHREFDAMLHSKARALAALTEFTEDGLEFDFVASDFSEFADGDRPQYFELWRDDASVSGRSPSLRDGNLARVTVAPDEIRYISVVLPDGRAGRQVTWAYVPKTEVEDAGGEAKPLVATPRDATSQDVDAADVVDAAGDADGASVIGGVTISVAAATTDIDHTLVLLGGLLAFVSGAAVVVSAVLLMFVVRGGLAPLRRVTAEIARIDERTLDARFSPQSVPDEIAAIAARLNGLLARLQAAFDRERAFSSDVAHELRTPLAGLRSTIEVCRSRPRSSAEYQEALDTCHEICDQAQSMVETLLVISQVEAGRVSMHTESFRLDDLLRRCWEPLAAAAADKGLRDDWQTSAGCEVETDRDKLAVVVSNVLQNGVAHSDAGGDLQVSAHHHDGGVRLCVENSGNRLSADQVQHVFERFWRGDAARTNTGQHAGLGLSLAQRLTSLLGGQLKVEVVGARFRVLLQIPKKPGSNGDRERT